MKGPQIEQSRSLLDGREATLFRTGRYSFSQWGGSVKNTGSRSGAEVALRPGASRDVEVLLRRPPPEGL